jgi:hypothetical protein
MAASGTPHNPHDLKRLICIFPHLTMNVKLFSMFAKKDPNSIVIAAPLNPSGGSRNTIDLILNTIDQNIFNLLQSSPAGSPRTPQIYEFVLIVEGNGGNTGSGTSIMEELVTKLIERCPYLKLVRTKQDVGETYSEGKVPLLCYTLGTGLTQVPDDQRPLSCDQIRLDWNAKFLNSQNFTMHSVIGQYLAKVSLEKVMEMLRETHAAPFPLSILSPSSTERHFTFSPQSGTSDSMSPKYQYPEPIDVRQSSDPNATTSSLGSPVMGPVGSPASSLSSPSAVPPSSSPVSQTDPASTSVTPTSAPAENKVGNSKYSHLSVFTTDEPTSSSQQDTPSPTHRHPPSPASGSDPDFDIGSVPIETSPSSPRNTFFQNLSEEKGPEAAEVPTNKHGNASRKKQL